MNATQVIAKLDAAQVNGAYDALTRRMMREEANNVRAAVRVSRNIPEATAEAIRVAKMYDVAI